MSRKGNPLTLLVQMQTSTVTMENSVEIPLKTGNCNTIVLQLKKKLKNKTKLEQNCHMTQQSPCWAYTPRNQNWKRHVYPNVHCSTVYNSQKPRCPSADEWIRKLWYIYTMEYHSVIKWNTFPMRRIKL